MNETLAGILTQAIILIAAGVTAWIKLKQEVTILKSRIHVLEQKESQVQKTLDLLVEGVNEIKLLLARKGIE